MELSKDQVCSHTCTKNADGQTEGFVDTTKGVSDTADVANSK